MAKEPASAAAPERAVAACATGCVKFPQGDARSNARRASRKFRRVLTVPASETHFQNIKPSRMPIDGIDDLALVDENVVELDGSGGCAAGCGRHKGGDFVGAEGIGNVVSAQAAVEERAENDPV